VQLPWLNDGNSLALGDDGDFLLGADSAAGGRGGKMTVQGDQPFFLAPQPSLVTTRGGEYRFVPGDGGTGRARAGRPKADSA